MSESGKAPSLLLFTLGSKRESGRRLLPTHLRRHESGFHLTLAQHVAAIAAKSACELVVSSPERPSIGDRWIPQSGSGFGERLASSIVAVSCDADRPLIVVGTDTPALSERHVGIALHNLAKDPRAVVIGPSRDGGMYLIGMAQRLGSLDGVRWCTRHARADLVDALRSAGRPVVLLESLSDIDTPRDLERWLAKRAITAGLLRISTLLRSLLRDLKESATCAPLRNAIAPRLSAAIRPPPAAV